VAAPRTAATAGSSGAAHSGSGGANANANAASFFADGRKHELEKLYALLSAEPRSINVLAGPRDAGKTALL
jgi:ATPase domain predominantly from Archaea